MDYNRIHCFDYEIILNRKKRRIYYEIDNMLIKSTSHVLA